MAKLFLGWMKEQRTIKFYIISILTSPWHKLAHASGKKFYFVALYSFFILIFQMFSSFGYLQEHFPQKRPRPLNEMRSSLPNTLLIQQGQDWPKLGQILTQKNVSRELNRFGSCRPKNLGQLRDPRIGSRYWTKVWVTIDPKGALCNPSLGHTQQKHFGSPQTRWWHSKTGTCTGT